ncbi:MAG: hypothetical protein CVV39_01730 [Planctomycetes bacterium HGW-Planctomycetes-1]|nr:MAG: hypothetical protein CVV39_01730 [Planctomycetes bacterium HGW-Planctomycetes-1]
MFFHFIGFDIFRQVRRTYLWGSFWPVPLLDFLVSYDLINRCDFLEAGSSPVAPILIGKEDK